MKKKDNREIGELASRAFADLVNESAPRASNIAQGATPAPEYRLAFRMDDRIAPSRKKKNAQNGPEIFPFVAAALALFVILPGLYALQPAQADRSRPTIENSFVAARDSGALAGFTDELKVTMVTISRTLQR
jgi:hypothetical protein